MYCSPMQHSAGRRGSRTSHRRRVQSRHVGPVSYMRWRSAESTQWLLSATLPRKRYCQVLMVYQSSAWDLEGGPPIWIKFGYCQRSILRHACVLLTFFLVLWLTSVRYIVQRLRGNRQSTPSTTQQQSPSQSSRKSYTTRGSALSSTSRPTLRRSR